ncbi:L-threonine 3-dehydrogenase [Pikeienuella sp. HZG-20]|uniref:L-threonine 3-dehydrogenase n=1 Tax=Paludibacillus litoralis TaxID=3133267 RepID=UPI0030ECBAA2
MRALVKTEPAPGLTLQEEPVPEIGPSDVLIKVRKTAICGTDVHIWNWDEWSAKTVPTPMVTGHEFCGEIVAIGASVKTCAVGQRVSGEGHVTCGRCRNCRAGRAHLCRATQGVGVNRPGAFADFLSLPEANVVPIPDDIPDEIAAIFDPFGNAVHTALSFDMVGEDVLVTGAGPIGIMGAMVARRAGARKVVITDINEDRLALARKMGVAHAINPSRTTLKEVMREIGMTEGFDVGLEMSGAAPAMRDMIDAMNNGGKIALLGIAPVEFAVDWNKVIFKMLTIKGIYGREIFETWYKMIGLVQGGLDLAPLITHRMAAEDFREGFELMRAGACGKVVLDWS